MCVSVLFIASLRFRNISLQSKHVMLRPCLVAMYYNITFIENGRFDLIIFTINRSKNHGVAS